MLYSDNYLSPDAHFRLSFLKQQFDSCTKHRFTDIFLFYFYTPTQLRQQCYLRASHAPAHNTFGIQATVQSGIVVTMGLSLWLSLSLTPSNTHPSS